MGELYLHDLNDYISKCKCDIFIETGTGKGVGLKYALNFNFLKFFSIEINETLYLENVERFKKFDSTRHDLKLLNNNSIEGLNQIFNEIGTSYLSLFWLDAHFPGADYGLGSFDDNHEKTIKLPLEDELKLIKDRRGNCKDVFIIDDLGLYEDEKFELKSLDRNKYGCGNINFAYEMFNETHSIKKDYRHHGFLILTPK